MNKNKMIVLGHKNPDVDSIISGYLLSSYLRYKKYDAEYIVPDKKVDEETKSILEECGIDVDIFSSGVLPDRKVILVDHYETDFENDIVAVIDHHPTIRKFNYPVYINEQSSSTTKHIYDLIAKESPSYISRRFVEFVVIGMVVDTCSFRSAKSKPGDREWVVEICQKYDIDLDKIMEIGDCVTSLEDIRKASVHGYKGYNYFGKTLGTSYIQVRGDSKKDVETIIEILQKKVKSDDLYMWVFISVNITDSKSVVYEIYADKVVSEEYEYIVSRGTNIMPKVEEKIKNIGTC